MLDGLKKAAWLLIIAGCIRLIVSDFSLGSYGTFRIPMHLQLVGPYILLTIAVIRVRSQRVARWLLVYLSLQVLFTFIICYKLPHTWAETLENDIPHIALAQVAAAALVLVGVQWYDRRVITRQQILFGLLIALNTSTLLMLEVFRSRLADAQQTLIFFEQGPAMQEAERDFKAGRFRQYEVLTLPQAVPVSAKLKHTFTGRTSGPFEIWSFPRYPESDDEAFWLKKDLQYVDFYNGRMAHLCAQKHESKPNRKSGQGRPPAPGAVPPVAPP